MSTYSMPPGGDPTATVSITVPTPTPSLSNDTKPELLCDWIRSAADCRDADFIRHLLITSSVMHGLVFLFAVWLLTYRNRGLNRKIVTELFVKVGTGIRPKPVSGSCHSRSSSSRFSSLSTKGTSFNKLNVNFLFP